MRNLSFSESSWPLAKAFVIARGARTQADVIQVKIQQGDCLGQGECVPYARYGESLTSVSEQILAIQPMIEKGLSIADLQQAMPAGAARNAVDCALWDLEARLKNDSVARLTQLGQPGSMVSAQTLSIDTPANMAKEARQYRDYPLLKVKLDADLVLERIQAVHKAAPNSKFILDANEAWDIDLLNTIATPLAEANVALIEQPLSANDDKTLSDYKGTIPLCADESFHCHKDLPELVNRYHAINIKLDKTGGLTEAMTCLEAARATNLQVMVGCMVGTSLAMAPATLLGQHADFVDLDGPALMAKDVANGFKYQAGQMSALNPNLWGN